MREDDRAGKSSRGVRDDLLSQLAHVFRTPLGLITGYVELLQLRDDPGLRAEALSQIGSAATRLSQETDRLLSALEQEEASLLERLLHAPGTRPRARPAEVTRKPRTPSGKAVTRLLLVDDDDEIRQLLLRTVPTEGFELVEACDGLEALRLLEDEQPDLIVLDWNMPNAGGGEVLAGLARRGLRVPVIVLTADADPKRRRVAEARGVDAFLAKPFSPLELLREIDRLLAGSSREGLGD